MPDTGSQAAVLRVIRLGMPPRVVPLPSGTLTLGRSVDNGLVLEDGFVSRHHAEVVAGAQGHILRDCQSKRGTFVNGEAVMERLLRPGDTISLGNANGNCIRYEMKAPAAAKADATDQILSVVVPEESRYLNTMAFNLADLRKGPALSRLKSLYELTTAIFTAGSAEELCGSLLKHVFEVLPCERGWTLLRGDSGQELEETARRGGGEGEHPSRTIVARVLGENVAILSRDAMLDERFDAQDSICVQAIRSVLCAPLGTATRVLGVCYFDSRAAGAAFDEEQLEFLMAACRQAGLALENIRLLQEQKRSLDSFISTLTAAIDARDVLTAGHSARVSANASAFASYLGRSEAEARLVRVAGLLHDVGKIGTHDAVLQKPGRLTEEELAHMQEHSAGTARILGQIRLTEELRDLPAIAAAHHENMDGSGYPLGLRAEEIPPLAPLLALTDVFDALTSKRHYREPMTYEGALGLLAGMAGTKFDRGLTEAFQRFVTEGRWQSD